ncbi:hypothetical protein AB0N64_01560 [Microbacterium sp. NPDC089318]
MTAKTSSETNPSDWDRARAEHWHGGAPTAETAARDEKSRAEKAKVMEITPEVVTTLQPDEVFVFGSNAGGQHGGGAARIAYEKFGAAWGEGHGHHGQTYAIDTMSGLQVLASEARSFLAYAAEHPELRFLLTPVGCGIAGYTPAQVAPLFAGAPENVTVPASFVPLL